MTYITTYTGRKIDFLNPDIKSIDIIDIAIGLSRECRFANMTRHFYSVANHSVNGIRYVPKKLRMHFLLHDAAEAYVGDVPKPLKNLLPEFEKIEDRLQEVIRKAFNIDLTNYEETETYKLLKEVDMRLSVTEARDVMKLNSKGLAYIYGDTKPYDDRIPVTGTIEQGRNLFLKIYTALL